LIFFAVMASNIAWRWAPNPYVAALIGVGLAIGATQIVIQFLAAVLRRNSHDSELLDAVMGPARSERLMWLSPDR